MLWRKIFNPPLGGVSNGNSAAETAKNLRYTMFCWNGTIYAVPPKGVAWDGFPLFDVEDM